MRVLMVALLVVAFGISANVAAQAAPKFSAVSVDARNGKILFSSDADGIRHPASLTKMMTLYILFQDLKAGKIRLDSPIRMSATAASRPPTKLGVKPGKTFPVETAIKALVVKSANDVAVAVAETLGGTEAAFAQRMTRTARSLGMSRTTFRNASGLPDPRQVTTARDMATLGLRLMRDFPQYYPYFRTLSFKFGGRTIATHNRLLKNYEGTDGIKTGYINASGYNLVSSTRRGSKRLVGVVLGGKTGASRNSYMMKMLDKTFPKASNGKTIAALAGSSKGAISPIGEDEPVATTTSSSKKKKSIADLLKKKEVEPAAESAVEATESVAEAGGDDEGEGNDEGQGNAASVSAEAPTQSQEPKVLSGSVGGADLPENLPFEVKTGTAPSPETATIAAVPEQTWIIQVGAYAAKNDAQARLLYIRGKAGAALDGSTAQVETVEIDNAVTYRARFSGFSEEQAKAACVAVKKHKAECYVVAPRS
ncbi:MAG: serine hydrolase [Alphaproteobacteria bacterium]|nr:serine hydrolase [Alphaproteobacteria bacterium]